MSVSLSIVDSSTTFDCSFISFSWCKSRSRGAPSPNGWVFKKSIIGMILEVNRAKSVISFIEMPSSSGHDELMRAIGNALQILPPPPELFCVEIILVWSAKMIVVGI
jgi:hypothetical protein